MPDDIPLMPLAHARDALGDLVSQFHNDMLRQGTKEMPARQWAEEFRGWIDPYDFERQCNEIFKWLSSPAEGAPVRDQQKLG